MKQRRGLVLFVVALGVTVLIAVAVSQFASSQPDGLEYVAEREGFADGAQDHALTEAPLAGYGENLGAGDGVSTGVAGLVGVMVAVAAGFGLFWIIRAPKAGPPDGAS